MHLISERFGRAVARLPIVVNRILNMVDASR